jgi:hypothetical protein
MIFNYIKLKKEWKNFGFGGTIMFDRVILNFYAFSFIKT